MQEISFGGKINYDDYKTFNNCHIQNSYIIKFIIFCIANSMVFFGLRIFGSDFMGIIYTILLSILIASLTTLTLVLIFFRKVKKLYNSSSRILIEQNYIITEQGIKCTNSRGESTALWEDIIRVIEYKNLIIIYTSLVQAIIISNSFFKTESDLLEFKKVLLDKLSKEKIKFKKKVVNLKSKIIETLSIILICTQFLMIGYSLFELTKIFHVMPWYIGFGEWIMVFLLYFPIMFILTVILSIINIWSKILKLKTLISMFCIQLGIVLPFAIGQLDTYLSKYSNYYGWGNISNDVFIYTTLFFTSITLGLIIHDLIRRRKHE